jgi:hypothetical protein
MRERPPASLGRALLVIGWREPVALPDWGIASIKTKIDTGARTSAIHVDRIESSAGGLVRFDVITSVRRDAQGRRLIRRRPVEAAVVRTARVRNSAGVCEDRIVVATMLRVGPVERPIELGLVCRRRMLCRMLLGRKALEHGFLIDPTHARLLTAGRARGNGRAGAASGRTRGGTAGGTRGGSGGVRP